LPKDKLLKKFCLNKTVPVEHFISDDVIGRPSEARTVIEFVFLEQKSQ